MSIIKEGGATNSRKKIELNVDVITASSINESITFNMIGVTLSSNTTLYFYQFFPVPSGKNFIIDHMGIRDSNDSTNSNITVEVYNITDDTIVANTSLGYYSPSTYIPSGKKLHFRVVNNDVSNSYNITAFVSGHLAIA